MTSHSSSKRNVVLLAAALVVGVVGWQLRGRGTAVQKIPEIASNPRLLPVQITPVALQTSYEVEDRFLGQIEARRSS